MKRRTEALRTKHAQRFMQGFYEGLIGLTGRSGGCQGRVKIETGAPPQTMRRSQMSGPRNDVLGPSAVLECMLARHLV